MPCIEIDFQTAGIKRICEDSREAQRRLGPQSARKLRARLADLQAASRLAEVTGGRPHPLKGDRAGQFSLDLAGGQRLLFVPFDDPMPQQDGGAIDWPNVRRVRIVFIGDPHD